MRNHLVVAWYLVMPHVNHVCMLLPLVRPHIKHACLGLHIAVSLKGKTARIWSFGCVSLVLLQWDVLGSHYYLI